MDAKSVDGMDAVVERAKAYVDSGADMIFPEGLASVDEFATVAESLRGYGNGPAPGGGPFLLANMTEFGKTPITPLSRFAELGYHAVIWPVSTFRIAMGAVDGFLGDLKANGHVENTLDAMMTRKRLYESLGYTPGEEWTCPPNM
jgi:methylisocitrate lyase